MAGMSPLWMDICPQSLVIDAAHGSLERWGNAAEPSRRVPGHLHNRMPAVGIYLAVGLEIGVYDLRHVFLRSSSRLVN